jgi:TetR/AcrR family transcriptional repressor of nem operon
MGRTSDARSKLLSAALTLIWQSSYGAVGVDQICEVAGVKKGSFYYFFASKSELAVAAYESYWESKVPDMEAIFSPERPPLERLECFCRKGYESQREMFLRHGVVVGCPYANVGSELATQDPRIRAKTQEIMERILAYLEQAISDAVVEGSIEKLNPKEAARETYSVILGALLCAKVENNPEVLVDLDRTVLRLLGARSSVLIEQIPAIAV